MPCQRREEKNWGEAALGDKSRKREGQGAETLNRERQREMGRKECVALPSTVAEGGEAG